MKGRNLFRHPARRLGVLIATAAVCTGLVVPASLPASAVASKNTVVEWNEHATNALIVTGLQPPGVSLLHLAMVHGAMYDAVNAIDGGYEPYLVSPKAKRWYSKRAAAATAAYKVLVSIVPDQKVDLRAHYDATLAGISSGAGKAGGIAVGKAAAAAMIEERSNDGRFGAPGFPVGTDPGEWRPTPTLFLNDPAAWVADVDPFLLKSKSQVRTEGPNELDSTAYAKDFNEVKAIGSASSTTRTAEQTDVALFWADHGAALWSRIFRQLSEGENLSTVENARFFAMLYLTGADAAINCWADKWHHGFWRPVTAIREAASDENPKTAPDEEWLPLMETPPFPEHPSGHGCASGSIAQTLKAFFGTDEMKFSGLSAVSKTTRKFTSFSQAIEEIVDARVYSGIHFRTADVQGALLGKKVANYVQEHFFESESDD